MSTDRMLRVNDEIMKELTEIIRDVKDPRVSSNFISITTVKTARDLRSARVYFSVLGSGKEEASEGLRSATSFIRRELAHRLNLRNTPELTFVYDDTEERGAKIEELIRELNKK